MSKINTIYVLIIFMIVIYIAVKNNCKKVNIILKNRKRRGGKNIMPEELIKQFVGKVCSISLFNNAFGVSGEIVAIENNWIKVENKNETQLINGDMITNIIAIKEKKK